MSVYDVVRENVTARQVAGHYGVCVNRNGMACCPFHNDKHPSMKVDKKYYCFGCGEKGDAIDFVSKYFGLSSRDAAIKIADDFGLDYKIEKYESIKKKLMKPKKSLEQEFREEQEYCFKVLSDYLHLLKKWKIEYAPKSMADEWNPLFCEALNNIDRIEYDGVVASRANTGAPDYIGREVRYYDSFRNYFGNYRYIEFTHCLWEFDCSVSCLSR